MNPTARRMPALAIAASVSPRYGCQLRMPTKTGSGVPAAASRCAQPFRLRQRQLGHRRAAADDLVVMRDFLDTSLGDPPAAQHIRQERANVWLSLRTAEGDHQHGVEGLGHVSRPIILARRSHSVAFEARSPRCARRARRRLGCPRVAAYLLHAMKRILVTNDDGVRSEGIHALAAGAATPRRGHRRRRRRPRRAPSATR